MKPGRVPDNSMPKAAVKNPVATKSGAHRRSTLEHDKCFISHNWSTDCLGRDNHARAGEINEALHCRDVDTWFDEQGDMKGCTMNAMTNGIDDCGVILVLITRDYLNKCKKEANDNCKLEFKYAYNRRGEQCMIPIVMEPDVRNPSTWDGPVGAALGSRLYIDFSDGGAASSPAKIAELIKEIDRISAVSLARFSDLEEAESVARKAEAQESAVHTAVL
jgi:hypothetical protein